MTVRDTRAARQSNAGRRQAGQVRISLWLPLDVATDLAVLCELASEQEGEPPIRCRTAAITNAIRAARQASSRPRRG